MFSERIRILRKEAGLTQAQAAQKVGLSSRGYQDLELGANPRGDTLVSLADFYGGVPGLAYGPHPMCVRSTPPAEAPPTGSSWRRRLRSRRGPRPCWRR